MHICLISSLTPLLLCLNPSHLPSFHFNVSRFTRWFKMPGAAELRANVRQCCSGGEKKAGPAQKASAPLHCILPRALICSALHGITRPLARTQQRRERSGRARERERRRHRAAGDRVGAAGQEEKGTEEKTWWLSLSSEVNTHSCIIKYLSWLTWKCNTTTHYCFINPRFSALCAKPVPFLSFSFSSIILSLSSCFPFSVTEDKPECDTPPECFSQSVVDQAPSQPETIQREERTDGPPRKKFLRAGLYSDDYKTKE